MNASLPQIIFACTLIAASTAVSASTALASADPTDQVAASFNRLLKPTSIAMTVTTPTISKTEAEVDPLLAGVNAVLWAQPSYHLPVRYASLSAKPSHGQ